jgi:hypothetical protein
MYYKNWGPCLQLLKIVICEVPTEDGHYVDYELIALFDNAVAYLDGGSERWRLLEDPDHFRYPGSCYRQKSCVGAWWFRLCDGWKRLHILLGCRRGWYFFGLFVALHHTLTKTLKLFL